MDNVTAVNNYASQDGIVYINSGSLIMNDVEFKNNNVSGNGGAVIVENSPNGLLSIISCVFNSNEARSFGIVYYNGDNVTIYDTQFIDNRVETSDGGAIYIPHIDGLL